MLQDRYSREQLDGILLPRDQWRPYPPAADRQAWDQLQTVDLNRHRAAFLIGKAEPLLDHVWPTLPATAYMTYVRDGQRRPYEGPYFSRRTDLAALVLAECFEHEGRFIDQVINCVWAICEESTWCVPAHIQHLGNRDNPDPLGRLDREIVDLFAAETAMVLAEACYILAAELDQRTRVLRERMKREVMRRVIEPVMDCGDFHWLTTPMNWNTWCSSNVLGAGFHLLDDPRRVADLAWQMMGSTDAFLAGQLPDGGCSEGPNYWGVAPGAMIALLELLHSRSAGKIDVYNEPLIRDLGLYLPRVHLDGPWFATFADCPPLVGVKRGAVYRYGERIGDASMRDLALLEMRQWDPTGEVSPPMQFSGCGGSVAQIVQELFWIPPDAMVSGAALPVDTWFPDLQVMVARESAESGRGLVVAAKGGHNIEHHNHNDVGQFIITADGEPMIVDVGVGTYTRETFGPRRYQIWCIRGSGHNVPVVNGVEQASGREFAATGVTHEATDDGCRMAMDLAGAYPAEADVEVLQRSISLSRGDNASVSVTDEYRLAGAPAHLELNLFTPADVESTRPGELQLSRNEAAIRVEYDPAVLSADVAEWPIDDARLQSAWGDSLRRLTFRTLDAAASGRYRLAFRRL